MVVSFMGTLCVLWLIVRFMVAAVRFMVNCAFYGYCAFYGLYTCPYNAIYLVEFVGLLVHNFSSYVEGRPNFFWSRITQKDFSRIFHIGKNLL